LVGQSVCWIGERADGSVAAARGGGRGAEPPREKGEGRGEVRREGRGVGAAGSRGGRR
jgi:hypothetical protein